MRKFLFILAIALFGGCQSDQPKTVSLIYMADIHGHFESHPEIFWSENSQKEFSIEEAGGAASLRTALDQIRKSNPDGTIFMDAGDSIQGAAEVALTEGHAAVPILNSLGIDLAVPGNWEVVYGTKRFKEISSKLNYPFIASNILDEKSKALVFPPYKIIEREGVRIGVIGFTDPDVPTRQPPSFSDGFIYQGSEVLRPYIKEVRKQADLIVLLTHIGLPKAVHLAKELQDVDVILSSDTHERTYEPVVVGETWVVEPGAFGSFLGKLDFQLKQGKVTKKWSLIEVKKKDFPENEEVKKIVKNSLDGIGEDLHKVIGRTDIPLLRYNVIETTLDAVLADALKKATGTEIAFSNGFRFAYPIVPGPIKEKDLWSIYPINTQIKTGLLTGQQIKDFFEREIENVFSQDAEKLFGGWLPRTAGLQVKFYSSKSFNERVEEILVNGEKIDLRRNYSVTTCVREGDPETTLCRIPNGKNIVVKDFDAHEAVRRYLQNNTVKNPVMNRVRATDLPEIVRSQYFKK